MVIAIANDHSSAPILNILQVQVENFTWAKSALKHQQNHRLIPKGSQRAEDLLNMLLAHGTGNALNRLDPNDAANGSLPRSVTQKRSMVLRNSRRGWIVHLLDGIF